MNKKEIEKLFKQKLTDTGVNAEWIKKHLIIDTIEEEDIKKYKKENKNE